VKEQKRNTEEMTRPWFGRRCGNNGIGQTGKVPSCSASDLANSVQIVRDNVKTECPTLPMCIKDIIDSYKMSSGRRNKYFVLSRAWC
jgi:hypothetical protein